MPAIVLHDIWKAYGAQQVLRGISLVVAPGQTAALLGPSGSGKTTILRILAGLEVPDRGEVTLAGRMVTGATVIVPPWERNVGMVFQDLALWPHMRVRRHLDFVLSTHSRSARKTRVRTMLELAELQDKAMRMPAQLSGGEQQRLAIVRALAPEPAVLLLDEPFAHLDPRLRDVFIDHLLALKTSGTTILLATHHSSDVDRLADHVVRFREPDVHRE